jgi:hypothetical protein
MGIIMSLLQIFMSLIFLYISVLSFLGHVLPDDVARELGYKHGKWVRELIINKQQEQKTKAPPV